MQTVNESTKKLHLCILLFKLMYVLYIIFLIKSRIYNLLNYIKL